MADLSSESGSSEDEEVPRGNAQDLLQYIQWDIITMADENKVKRKFALMNIYNVSFVIFRLQTKSLFLKRKFIRNFFNMFKSLCWSDFKIL